MNQNSGIKNKVPKSKKVQNALQKTLSQVAIRVLYYNKMLQMHTDYYRYCMFQLMTNLIGHAASVPSCCFFCSEFSNIRPNLKNIFLVLQKLMISFLQARFQGFSAKTFRFFHTFLRLLTDQWKFV